MDNSTNNCVESNELHVFSIPVLWVLRSAQQEHGLRHRDYQRYRQFITRKIRRMRKVLDFRQGNRSKVIPKSINPSMIEDARFITLRIFEVERCWAHAMELKEESEAHPRKRFHVISKMRKASKLAYSLSQLLDSLKFDPTSRLEIQAYTKWISGVLFFEMKNWKLAKENLEGAHAIYIGLSKSSDDDSRELFLSKAEEINPQIRYCAYNIGDTNAANDLRKLLSTISDDTSQELEQLIDQARCKEAEKVTEVLWMGQKIPVKLEQARSSILAIQQFDTEILSQDPSNFEAILHLYESVLKSCVSGITVIKDSIKSMEFAQTQAVGSSVGDSTNLVASKKQAQVTTPISTDKMSRSQLLLSYLQYAKFERTVGRSLAQISNALSISKVKIPNSVKDSILGTSDYPKAQELARLYDTVVQNLNEIQSLPGILQKSTEFSSTFEARIFAYKTFRCYYLALAHGQNKKFHESLALLKRAAYYAKKTIHDIDQLQVEIKSSKFAKEYLKFANITFDDLKMQLEVLFRQVANEDLALRAQKILYLACGVKNSDDSNSINSNKPLVEALDIFLDRASMERKLMKTPNGQPLIQFPPNFVPIPMKTTFFDLALNHVEYPSYQERVRKTVEVEQISNSTTRKTETNSSHQKGGISGFVKGWIWGGQK